MDSMGYCNKNCMVNSLFSIISVISCLSIGYFHHKVFIAFVAYPTDIKWLAYATSIFVLIKMPHFPNG